MTPWFDIKPEKAFLVLALIFGLLMVFIMAPFQVPDEKNHFLRSYQVSTLKLTGMKQGNISGGYIPVEIIKFVHLNINVRGKPHKKVNLKEMLPYLHQQIDFKNVQLVNFSNSVLYFPIVYFPQAVGMGVARLCHLSLPFYLYFGRILNFLSALLLLYLAIKLTPLLKWGMVVLALMPMTLQQISSLSADALTISISFLFVAVMLRFAFYKKEFNTKDLLLFFLVALLLSLVKVAYLPLIFSYFLIPSQKIGSRWRYFFYFCLVFIAAFGASAIWSALVHQIYIPYAFMSNVVPVQQALYILKHPLHLFSVFGRTYLWHLRSYLYSFIGSLGYLDIHFSRSIYNIYFLLLILLPLYDFPAYSVNKTQRVICAIILLANFCLINALIYLTYCSVGYPQIVGIQGRYFIPFSPLWLIILHRYKANERLQRILPTIIFYLLIVLLTIVMYVVFKRYYL